MKIKRIFAVVSIILFVSSVGLSWAVTPRKVKIVRKTILDYKDELKLSDAQVKKIKKYFDDLRKKVQDVAQKIRKLETELRDMLKKEENLKKIKSKIYEIYKLKAELVIANLETGRKIEGVLNKQQLKKWREIKKRESEKIRELLKNRSTTGKK